MRRKLNTTFSALSGIVFLFIVLLVFVAILTNQFLVGFLHNQQPVSVPLVFLGFLFIAIFLVVLIVYIVTLIRDWRQNQPGIRFKTRLVIFFSLVVFLSSAPPLFLTANILRNAFDVWFIRDTEQSLSFGLEAAIFAYQEKSESLSSISNSRLMPVLLQAFLKDKDESWQQIRALNTNIDSMQVFDSSGKSLAAAGDSQLWLQKQDLAILSKNQITKLNKNQDSILYTLRNWELQNYDGQIQLVMCSRLPTGFEAGASLISATRQRLTDLTRLPVSFQLQVFWFYVLFFVPLILIAVMVSFYLADAVVHPLLQLEQAVNRVTQGDYSTRLIARQDETMGHFINSFNDMVGELERSRNDLKQSERLQTWQEIAQRMAHEIKNPLTPIKLAAERIVKKYRQSSPDFSQILEEGSATIIQEVGSISNLLTEFRNFARLPQPMPEPINFKDMIKQTWALYDGTTSVKLDLSNLADSIMVSVDVGQFMQVFRNLFQNAIDAAQKPDSTILVRAFAIDKLGIPILRIQIHDEGMGISPENLKDVFAPYFTTKKQGSGLGLAIVEKIILDHGGRIWVESQIGIGTSFFIDLPRTGADKH